ncbi:hypothetical protein HK100_008670 [Physocladia obscura]|uniref:Uncharacterized protein n=1 Tax=Physocladia obscura TaxID=109957 RepID=A0AAD5SMM9_9FUNG|nr:hypothetical protein HK100_008670 [Physocladia obscura]
MSSVKTKIKEIGPGCFNLRGPFKALGLIELGTHMTFILLSSGKFVAFSTVQIDAAAKVEIDALTDNGKLLEAVVATNAHHTLSFSAFHALYPNAAFYGTPRHIRKFNDIPWKGDVSDTAVSGLWEPEISLKNTDTGIIWDEPSKPEFNHFPGVIVYHRGSKTLFCDDSLIVVTKPNFVLKAALGVKKPNDVAFAPTLFTALTSTADAPQQFYNWIIALLDDWDVENIATAHGGTIVGGGSAGLREALDRIADGKLGKIAKDRKNPLILTKK